MGVGAAGAVAIAASVASIAGAGVAAYGSIKQGQYSAQVARNNAQIAKQNSTYSAQAGLQSAAVTSQQKAAEYGQLVADQSANGVDINSGSNVDVRAGAKSAAQLDEQTVMHNAILQAYGYQQQVSSDTAQASQDQQAGYLDAGAGLLSSASSIGLKWSAPSGASAAGAGTTTGTETPLG